MNIQCVLQDPMNRLHWNTIKSAVVTLSLLPAGYIFHYLWTFSEQDDMIFIRFFALNLLGAWVSICFLKVLRTHQQVGLMETLGLKKDIAFEHYIFHLYQQLPMLFFIALLTGLLFIWCA